MTRMTSRLAVAGWVLSATVLVSGAAHAAMGDCGQPLSTGSMPVSTDALFVLRVGVGLDTCDACVCDVDRSGGSAPVTAVDALIVLRVAVGLGGSLDCESCVVNCEDSAAPQCGGSCDEDSVCMPDNYDPGVCRCFDGCESATEPMCTATCEDDRDSICQVVTQNTVDGGTIDICNCIPDGIIICANASAPECGGICGPGALCGDDGGGGCACIAEPVQGECNSASAPTCGGVCPVGMICEVTGPGACDCVPFDDPGSETCRDSSAPSCGGTCGDGELCAVGIGGGDCECRAPCELSGTPTCGGDCPDSGESCVYRTFTIGGQTLEICECRQLSAP